MLSYLIENDWFENNAYYKLYCELIKNSCNNIYTKYMTAKHHIIPKAYYKLNNLKVDNSQNNIAILTHKEHILAHYYLCHFVKNSELLYKMQCAFLSMIKELPSSFESLQSKLNDYESIMQQCLTERSMRYKGKPGYKWNEEQKQKAKLRCINQHKGFIWVYNKELNEQHLISPDDLYMYPEFKRGKLPASEEAKNNMKKGQQKQSAKDARKRGHITHAKNIEKRKQEGEVILVPNLAKPVICLELNKTFSSIKEAKLWLGRGDVEACANRAQRVAGNYHWAFCDDKEWIELQIQHMNETKDKYNKIINQNKHPGKAIICIELDKEFNSVTEAIAWLRSQYKKGDIYAAVKYGTPAGGYHWKVK